MENKDSLKAIEIIIDNDDELKAIRLLLDSVERKTNEVNKENAEMRSYFRAIKQISEMKGGASDGNL